MKTKILFLLMPVFILGIFSCSKDYEQELDDAQMPQEANLKNATYYTYNESEPNNTKATADCQDPGIMQGTYIGNSCGSPDYVAIYVDDPSVAFYFDCDEVYVYAYIYKWSNDQLVATISGNDGIGFTDLPVGEYYAKIDGYHCGAYKLLVDPNYNGTYNESEPNNSKSAADYPGIIRGKYVGNSCSSADYARVNVINSKVSFYFDCDEVYVYAYLYKYSNDQLITSISGNQVKTLNLSTGEYYVKIDGYHCGDYALWVDPVLEGSFSESEPNNTKSTADYPEPGITKGSYSGNSCSSADYARILVKNPGTTFYFDCDEVYVYAYIYKYSNDQLIATLPGNRAVTFNNLALGEYYVKIDGYHCDDYVFWVDPDYSVVNSRYFDMYNYDPICCQTVDYYYSSPSSWGSGYWYELYDFSYYYSYDGYFLYKTSENNDNYFVDGFYGNNDWPIFVGDIIVGMK